MSSYYLRAARRLIYRPLSPRSFPTAGFTVIDNSRLVEEETNEWYKPEEFYPVRIGQVFNSQYQVIAKLGYGSHSTVWLCRDLDYHRHVALKIGIHKALSSELSVLRHLRKMWTIHVGASLVRDLLDEFEVVDGDRKYQAIVHTPSAITVEGYRMMFPDKSLPIDILKWVLEHILIAVDYLHTEAKVIHTDIQDSNILLGMNESTAKADLEKIEMDELESSSPRKVNGDRVIYTSRPPVPRIYRYGRPVLSDLGEARLGLSNHMRDIQPFPYRAPEVILTIPWNEKVDIWNVGVLIWNLFENGHCLFKTKGGPENKDDNKYHLAHMIALLGPPPKDFLERAVTDQPWEWFEKDGTWKGTAEIPNSTLEDAETKLGGEEKVLFLQFVRKMLKWKPEERQSARELLQDPWLKKE